MKLRPLRSWGLWLTLVLFLPAILSAQGVVIETVAEASAPEKEQIEGALAIQERWAPGGVAAARSLELLGGIAGTQGDMNKAAMYLDKSGSSDICVGRLWGVAGGPGSC
jgi:hypothetical protein